MYTPEQVTGTLTQLQAILEDNSDTPIKALIKLSSKIAMLMVAAEAKKVELKKMNEIKQRAEAEKQARELAELKKKQSTKKK